MVPAQTPVAVFQPRKLGRNPSWRPCRFRDLPGLASGARIGTRGARQLGNKQPLVAIIVGPKKKQRKQLKPPPVAEHGVTEPPVVLFFPLEREGL